VRTVNLLAPTRPRLEAALSSEATCGPCPRCLGLVFAPGWWCDDCQACAYPLALLDCDHESNGDEEPDEDLEQDDDYF